MNRLQNAEYQILCEIKKIMEKHNLRYVLWAGTMLGAVRHHGFIPWDDDIDIALPREDYEIFRTKCKELLSDGLDVFDYSGNRHYVQTYIKVHDTRTTFIENSNYGNRELWTGVFVDVFPLDYLPCGKMSRSVAVFTYKLLCHLNNFYRRKYDLFNKYNLTKLIDYNAFNSLILWLSTKYKSHSEEYIDLSLASLFDNTQPIFFKRKSFKELIDIQFEEDVFLVPEDYDDVLTTLYGDWRQLPPEEDRVSNHDLHTVDLDKSYFEFD